jgi:predicted DNA-binding ribbon-helix-helix protein
MKATVRASITFPPDLYETLEEIAKQKKVSVAWVVSNLADKYVAKQAIPKTIESNHAAHFR